MPKVILIYTPVITFSSGSLSRFSLAMFLMKQPAKTSERFLKILASKSTSVIRSAMVLMWKMLMVDTIHWKTQNYAGFAIQWPLWKPDKRWIWRNAWHWYHTQGGGKRHRVCACLLQQGLQGDQQVPWSWTSPNSGMRYLEHLIVRAILELNGYNLKDRALNIEIRWKLSFRLKSNLTIKESF